MTESMKLVPILKVEGIGKVYAEKLIALGIETTKDLLEKGRTPSGREELVKKTGISPKLILEWVQDSDLMRIKGVSEEYSDLLDEVDVKDAVDLATKDPEELHQKILEACSKKNITRKPPYLKTVQKWIEQAKTLPKVIQY
jgi:predicted flap endonuclease-1-like 5' DNA nuclease